MSLPPHSGAQRLQEGFQHAVVEFDTVRGGTHCICGLGCEADNRRKGGCEAKEREHAELSMRRGLEMLIV